MVFFTTFKKKTLNKNLDIKIKIIMNKDYGDIKIKKQNISISVHEDILSLIEKHCKHNKIKKSKFIEDVLKEHFKNKIII